MPGPPHRDLVQPSLLDPDLTLRAIGAHARVAAAPSTAATS